MKIHLFPRIVKEYFDEKQIARFDVRTGL